VPTAVAEISGAQQRKEHEKKRNGHRDEGPTQQLLNTLVTLMRFTRLHGGAAVFRDRQMRRLLFLLLLLLFVFLSPKRQKF
jgi:hypothetical protein